MGPGGKKPSGSTEYQLRNYLLLLATLVATVTYAAGLNLPGGVWQDTQDGHIAGDLILHDTHYDRYLAFYYCNATAFAASLVVCLLLLILNSTSTAWAAALRVVMVLDLLALMGAYASGSCRDAFTTIYSSVIMSAVFAYIMIAFFVYVYSKKKDRDTDKHKQEDHENKEKGPVKQDENPEKQGEGSEEHKPDDQHEDSGKHKREDQHEVLMLLATFVVTITYVAGLNPPGGFWSNSQDGHRVSGPILQDDNSIRYQAFFVCNTTAFVSSLFIVILLLDKKLILSLPAKMRSMSVHLNSPSRPSSPSGPSDQSDPSGPSIRFVALYGFITIALCGLVGAYAAGSCRELDTTIYVVSLIGAVVAYIFLQMAITKAVPHNAPAWLQNIKELFVEPERPTGSNSRDNEATEKAKANEALKTDKPLENPDDVPGKAKADAPTNTKGNKALEKARNLVILLATLVASITYSAGLDPPGGLWQDDQDGHKVGDPILLTTHPTRYKVFFYCNSAAFVASLIVITMVRSSSLLKRHTLEAAMLLDLFGLIGAYAAGSCRDVSTSIYVAALAGAVFIYVVIHIVFFTLDPNDNKEDATLLDNRREVLLLLAILVAALTYQAGLTPPGGFWSADDNLGHHAGFPVLLDNFPSRYRAFFYCNAMSFMASVALIVLLVNPNLYKPGIRCYALYVCMVAGMFGLMGAYAAGSARSLRTSIYAIALVAAVFAFVILQVVIFWFTNQNKKTPKESGQVSNISNDVPSDPADGKSGRGVGSSESSETRAHSTDIEAAVHPKGKTEKEPQAEEENLEEKKEKDLREYLMLVGVLAASVTYQTGLKPPGGLWQDNSNGHTAGNSILHDMNKSRYHAFFYSNSTSFMASIVVVVLLLPRTLHKSQKLLLWPMHTAIVLNMLGLLGAYAAGSTRDWETSKTVIYLAIPVLVYIAAYAAWSFYERKIKAPKEIPTGDEQGQGTM